MSSCFLRLKQVNDWEEMFSAFRLLGIAHAHPAKKKGSACCHLHHTLPSDLSSTVEGYLYLCSCVLSFDRRVANVCVKLCVELPGRGAEAHAVQPKRTLAVSISRSLGQPAPFFLNSG